MTQVTTQTATVNDRIFEVLASGNISILKPEERTEFYRLTCESLGVNPLTKPFEYLVLNGKTVLYATRTCADQLRKIHGISISEPRIEYADGLCIVTVTGTDATGRTDSEVGAVPLSANVTGEARSNAIMKAVTKSKRRLTLSMAGLGWLDESEVDSIPESAKRAPVQMPQPKIAPPVDQDTGEIVEDKHALMWEAFWQKAEALGFSREAVRDFVNVDAETFDAMSRTDLQRVLNDLKAVPA